MIRCSCQKTNKLFIEQNPSSAKDYIYISDAVNGIIKVMTLMDCNRVVNIASGTSSSLEKIDSILDLHAEYSNSLQANFSNISIELSKQLFNFEPKISIEEGLNKIINKDEEWTQ